MSIVVTAVVFAMAGAHSVVGQCLPTGQDQKTSWGHMNVVIGHYHLIREVAGIIVMPFSEKPLSGVLVEVFDHPERVFDQKGEVNPRRIQNRLVVCLTSADGKFAFKLPSGKYEVRCSKAGEWDATSMMVEISKSRRVEESRLTIPLHLSQ